MARPARASVVALVSDPTGQDPAATTAADVMTADEVAAMLRVNRKTVYEAVERGDLPCARLGRRVLFSRAALLRWLDRQGPRDGPTA